jgi:hypothetical protein
MSVTGLGNIAKCNTLVCDKLEAKNVTPGDPHLITGDLEVTGNLKVDGGVEIDAAGIEGLKLKSKPSINNVELSMNDNTNIWRISAQASTETLFTTRSPAGGGSGDIVSFLTHAAGNYIYTLSAQTIIFDVLPTSAPAGTGRVWNNGGVLNIT